MSTQQPVGIRIGVALERHNGGGQTIRAVTCIPALTGAWKHVGGYNTVSCLGTSLQV